MEDQLFREFEELEGLDIEDANTLQRLTDDVDLNDGDLDEIQLAPSEALSLSTQAVIQELKSRGIKPIGFHAEDAKVLQAIFNEEHQDYLERVKKEKRENKIKSIRQKGLQKRRILMETQLREEQEAIANDPDFEFWLTILRRNQTPPTTKLSVNSIMARALAKAVWKNTSLTALDLSSNGLNDHAGGYIARTLKKNSSLVKLELGTNQLGPKTCLAFADSLKYNQTLKFLSLESNPLTGMHLNNITGISALGNMLTNNDTLISLNLWRCYLNTDCGNIISASLKDNDTMLILQIGHNDISQSDQRKIVEKLEENRHILEELIEDQKRIKKSKDKEDNERKQIKDKEERAKEVENWLEQQIKERAKKREMETAERIRKIEQEKAEAKEKELERIKRERKEREEAEAKKKKKKKGKGKGKKKGRR